MNREEYLDNLLKTYAPMGKLSERNGNRVLLLKHRSMDRRLIFHSSEIPNGVYERLLTVKTPYLPEIYDVIDFDDGQVVLQEFIEGISVSESLKVELFSYRDASRILKSVLKALHILHGLKIIHRDVKPENIILGASGRVVLIDLDAARFLTGAPRDTVIMGTVGFVSPEQLGLHESDERTDIYAAGVLLNVLLTGKLPTETVAPGKAGRIVRKCTMINPLDRYQSAEEMLAQL